jgi:hypothetical protein
MATKDQQVARNLLTYRYNQLDKAIENAQNNLGFKTDCPLSNGYHEWENATMNGKSHMKKSIETDDCFFAFNYYPLITLMKRTRSFNWYCTSGIKELISLKIKSICNPRSYWTK